MTIGDCARQAAEVLVQAGVPHHEGRRDVAVLARHLLRWDVAAWLTRQREEAPSSLGAALAALVERRASGEPVAYLIGSREFFGRDFMVTPAVLIPRPETELIVERALALIAHRSKGPAPVTVIDVGTGSGCIGVTLAAECPVVRVTATDTSAAALTIAAANAARHGVAHRISFNFGALTAGGRDVDVVVSNPPYIANSERSGLMRDVRDFEPAAALFGGEEGLDVIADLLPDAFRALRAGGTLLVEIGSGQAEAVTARFAAAGFEAVTAHRDLADIPRVIEGVRPQTSV